MLLYNFKFYGSLYCLLNMHVEIMYFTNQLYYVLIIFFIFVTAKQ